MLYLGQYNELQLLRFTSVGAYLGNDEGDEVLLPNRYVSEEFQEGDQLRVFVYLDSEERPVATTETPKIELHTFAYLEVTDVNHLGAFLDWGLLKQLFCPYREQLVKMEEGKSYLVYLYLDDSTQRLVASAKTRRFLERERIVVEEGDEVDLLITDRHELGQQVIVNDTYGGMIFNSYISRPLLRGERCSGYVLNVREDGKLDIALEKKGYARIEPAAEQILEKLREAGGHLPVGDKSDPDDIREQFGLSKKAFKQALGNLYRKRMVDIEGNSIRLIQ
ncbi:MAG: GntR family transcriptional regulator [Bacteroidetes bacterium]|nr:MAG: GntR family transcriptional regulator [Bacteroidota bacterium]